MDNIKTIYELEKIVQDLKHNRKKIITTNGTFDLIHSAHINFLRKTRSFGDVLVVLLNNDESVRRNKGSNRPIISEQERAYLLSELKPVDYVVIFPQDKPLEYLAKIKPHIHVKGGTYIPERIKEEEEFVKKLGGEYMYFEFEEGFSTTNIINKILELYK